MNTNFKFIFSLLIVSQLATLAYSLEAINIDILDKVIEKDLASIGLQSFEQARSRYWSAHGTSTGNLILLNLAESSFKKITDDKVKLYLLSLTALYKGFEELRSGSHRRARAFFKDSMRKVEKSLKVQSIPDAHRVHAEASYFWIYSKRLFQRSKFKQNLKDLITPALIMDPDNIPANITFIMIQMKQTHRKDKASWKQMASRLEKLENQHNMDPIDRFQLRVMLSKVYKKLSDNEQSQIWCASAAEIFPNNPEVKHCRP